MGRLDVLRPIAKLRLLAEHHGIGFDRAVEPWGFAIYLFKFRNRVVHARPEQIEKEFVLTTEEQALSDTSIDEMPAAAFELMLTAKNADKSLATFDAINGLFRDKVHHAHHLGLFVDGAFYSVEQEDVPPGA